MYPFQQKENCPQTLKRVSLCLKPHEVTRTIVPRKCVCIMVEISPFENADGTRSCDPHSPALPCCPYTPSPDWIGGTSMDAPTGVGHGRDPPGASAGSEWSWSQATVCVRKSARSSENDLQSPVIETHLERGSEKSRGKETCTVNAHRTRIKRETTARPNNSIKHDKALICPRDKDLAWPYLLGDTQDVGRAGDARAPASVCVCKRVGPCECECVFTRVCHCIY